MSQTDYHSHGPGVNPQPALDPVIEPKFVNEVALTLHQRLRGRRQIDIPAICKAVNVMVAWVLSVLSTTTWA